MKLRKQQIEAIVTRIAEELSNAEAVKCQDAEEFKAMLRKLIVEDLMIEDRLNDEVHKILDEHSSQIREGSIEYHKMFRMVKEKLAKERNLIL